MFIELVDSLRCPHDHEESWLVLGAERMDGRNVLEGVLGCPVCRRRFRISAGVADLRTGGHTAESAADAGHEPPPADPEQAMRLAAFLNLSDGGGYAVLAGAWTRHAAGVRALADTHLLLVNPEPGVGIGPGLSGLLADTGLPVAPGSARALALDTGTGPEFLEAALRGVQARGASSRPWSSRCPMELPNSPAMHASGWPNATRRPAAWCRCRAARADRQVCSASAGSSRYNSSITVL